MDHELQLMIYCEIDAVSIHFILQFQKKTSRVTRNLEVTKQYINFIHRNKEKLETKSDTRISVPSLRNAEGKPELNQLFYRLRLQI